MREGWGWGWGCGWDVAIPQSACRGTEFDGMSVCALEIGLYDDAVISAAEA